MPKSITEKVALITGAARRVGAEIAKTLHDAGMHIVLHFNTSAEEANQLAQQLNQKRPNSAATVAGDLTDTEVLTSLIQQAVATWGRLDVLVNNASRFYRTEIGNTSEYAWDDLLTSNLKAPFFLCQGAAPFLAKHHGCIVNIGDIHGSQPLSGYPVYCISKAGILMLTKVLAKELAPHVRVNTVSPGVVIWPEGENAVPEDTKQQIREKTPLAREGSPADIAQTVLFLVRDANYMTGENIIVDGGRMLAD